MKPVKIYLKTEKGNQKYVCSPDCQATENAFSGQADMRLSAVKTLRERPYFR